MYVFVMEQLGKLEERLLELLTEAEIKASAEPEKSRWTLVPESFRWSTGIAMSWLPVRAKALELVKQRDALGSRVLFAQMSMISSWVAHSNRWGSFANLKSRVRDQESRETKREERHRERLEKLEAVVNSQHEKLDRLEDLVYRVMHRSRITFNDGDLTSRDEENPEARSPRRRSGRKSPLTSSTNEAI